MLLHMNYFGPVVGRNDPVHYKEACENAFRDFCQWKRENKIVCSQRKFSFWTVFKEEYGCYMNTKGYCARVVSSWLESVLERALDSPPAGMVSDDRSYTCLVTLTLCQICVYLFW